MQLKCSILSKQRVTLNKGNTVRKPNKKQRETIANLEKTEGEIVISYFRNEPVNNTSENRRNQVNTITVGFKNSVYNISSTGRIN